MIRSTFFLLSLFLMTGFSAAQSPEIDSLQIVLKSLPQDTNRVNTLLSLCRAKFYFSVDSIPHLANEALDLAKKIHFEAGEADAYSRMGIYHHHKGNTAEATDSFLKALVIYERLKDSINIADLNNKMGIIYLNQGQNNEARNYFSKSYNIWHRLNYKHGLTKVFYNIGVTYETDQNDSLALINYQQALKLSHEINDNSMICGILKSIGDVYSRNGEYDTSLDYMERALQKASEAYKFAWFPAIYTSISKIYTARDMPHKALAAADSAMKYAVQLKSRIYMADSYSCLQQAYEKLRDYQKAYQYQSLYIVLKDSLKSEENVNAIEKLRREYEVEKKDMEMDLLTCRYEAGIFRRNTFIGVLAALLALMAFIYFRYKANAKRKLAARKSQLDLYTQSLLEKSEIINRISNELAKLKGSQSDDEVDIEKFSQILNLNIHTEENWKRFKELFDEVYPDFFTRLRYQCPAITPSELRLSAIIKLNMSLRDSAAMLGISAASVKQGRYRLRKKFEIDDSASLEAFVAGIK